MVVQEAVEVQQLSGRPPYFFGFVQTLQIDAGCYLDLLAPPLPLAVLEW